MTFRSYATATSGQTLYAHQETTTIGGVSYYLHQLSSADGNGTTLTASAATTGRKLMGRWVYPLSGVISIPASTWTVTYRAMKSASAKDVVAHGDVDILIRMSNGIVRSTIATDVANSPSLTLTNNWETLTGTYNWAAYTVVDQTDYLEVAYYIEVTTSRASKSVFLRVDDGTLALADQTKIANIMLPSEYTMEVEFTGTSNIEDWTQLVWIIDSTWTTASVSVTLQLYNYQTGQYPTSGDGCISYTSSSTPDTDETQSQTITLNPTYFRDANGNWKIKVKGVKSTTTQFDFKADLVEYKTTIYAAQAPIASFTYSPANPSVYDTVTFNASASYDPDGNIVSYRWDFGDGNITTITDPIITHVYATANSTVTYTVNLTVTDNEGLTNSTTDTVPVINPSVLRISLPAGTYVGADPDPWLNDGWLLNITGASGTFTLRINNTSASITSYDTHLIIALNNASYNNLDSLSVNGAPISTFQYGTPKPYNLWDWPSGDVYPTWFNDTYIVGPIDPKNYTDLTVSVTFSNATGARMHFDAYGSTDPVPPPPDKRGRITHNPLSEDSTVLFTPPITPPINRPPVAIFTESAETVDTGEDITFNATDSYDPDGMIASYFWDFGDGNNATGMIVNHAYADNGTCTVTLTVTDDDGATNSTSATKTILNRPPVALFTESAENVSIGEVITFNASDSYDPDGYIVTYFWDFGDDTNTTGVIVDHAYANSGTYTVTLTVTDNDGASASAMSNKTVVALLSVSISPTSVVMDVGQSQTFISSVSGGTSPYSYQWYLNGAPVSGATSSSWTFTPTSSGSYTVYLNVTDNVGVTAQSNIVPVTVNPALAVSISPSSVVMDVGQSQTFTSSVSGGTTPYSYQWYLDGTPVPGATSSSWVFTPISAGSYNVYLNVTDNVWVTAQSNIAQVTVNAAPTVSISPTSVVMDLGQSQIFTSIVSGGTSPYSYQWYLNGTAVSGATSASWTFTPTSTGYYLLHVNVTDNVGVTAQSNIASVTVKAVTLTVSISPSSASIYVGQSQTFTSSVSGGTPPYSYQWYLNGSAVSGATASSWTFAPTSEGYYLVHLNVTDNVGVTAQSNTASVTVTVILVGGHVVPVDKLSLLAPSIGLISALMAVIIVTITLSKRKRKH